MAFNSRVDNSDKITLKFTVKIDTIDIIYHKLDKRLI